MPSTYQRNSRVTSELSRALTDTRLSSYGSCNEVFNEGGQNSPAIGSVGNTGYNDAFYQEIGEGVWSASPLLTRTISPVTGHSNGRTVIIGASHMRRMAQALIDTGAEVIDLSSPGWTPSKENLKNVAEYMKKKSGGGGTT